jgi:hypothetical protein
LKIDNTRVARNLIIRLIDSELSVKDWAELNNIGASLVYKWLAYFRDNEPDIFGDTELLGQCVGKNSWYARFLQAKKEARMLCIKKDKSNEIAPSSANKDTGFIVIDTNDVLSHKQETNTNIQSSQANCIVVNFANTSVSIPSGTKTSDIKAVLSVVSNL